MNYIRPVDFAAFRPNEFHSQLIADRTTGLPGCVLISSRVPTGTGTTQGLHVHPADQFYYVLEGEMNVQIGAAQYTAGPNSLVCIPAGAPHWNWNSQPAVELHFELITPTPPGGLAYAYAVDVPGLQPAASDSDFFVRRLNASRFDTTAPSRVRIAGPESGIVSCTSDAVELPAGSGSRKPVAVEYDQVFYTVSGEIDVVVGEERAKASSHAFVIVPAGRPYALRNEGPGPARHLAVRFP